MSPTQAPRRSSGAEQSMPYADLRETNTSVVVLLGDRACKLKKPVDLGFLDFRTVEARERACARKVELHRRMAPDVYLGTGGSTQPDGSTEPVVVMRRMPDELRLATLVAGGESVEEPLRRLARDLASFHASADAHPVLQLEARRDRVRARWHDSIDQVRRLDLDLGAPGDLDRLTHLVDTFLAGREPLFAHRIEAGHVVDGLDDAAFLAMDLERLGAAERGAFFLGRYAELAGDAAPTSLRHHFLAYRAFVAKVSSLRAAQGDPASVATALDLTEIALRHLAAGTVRLLLVGGLPGTGKSTLAGLLADEHGYVLLSSDRIRKVTAGLSPDGPSSEAYGEGLYSAGSTDRTYAELLRRAGLLLALGESVVIDASWTSAELTELCCCVPAAVASVRLRSRAPGASDADEVVAARMATEDDAWPSAVVIETNGPPLEALDEATAAVLTPGRLGSHVEAGR